MKNDHIFHLFLCGLTALCLLASTGCASKRYGNLPPEISGASASRMGVNIVRTATTQLGKPYRLGGASPRSGFDCSGLIYWSFGQNGITVPRVTSSQAKVGTKVAINRLQPGDIVVLEAGDMIVADGRILHSYSLQVNESSLTGESANVEKTDAIIEGDVALADRANMVYSGSLVTY